MLFPRDPQATTTGIELDRGHDGFPVVLAVGLLGDDASGLPLLPNGPGLPLLGEAVDSAPTDLAIHGHAHAGSERGTTPGGVRVRNVAHPVIKQAYNVYQLGSGVGGAN